MCVAFPLAVFLLLWFGWVWGLFCKVGMGGRSERGVGGPPPLHLEKHAGMAGSVDRGWCGSLTFRERTRETGALAAAGIFVVFIMEIGIWDGEIPVLDSFIRSTIIKPLASLTQKRW